MGTSKQKQKKPQNLNVQLIHAKLFSLTRSLCAGSLNMWDVVRAFKAAPVSYSPLAFLYTSPAGLKACGRSLIYSGPQELGWRSLPKFWMGYL